MQQNPIAITISAILLSLILAFPTLAVEAPRGTIRVTKADPDSERKASLFVHEKHENYDCELCHHTWDGDGDIETCASCHPIFRHAQHLNMDCEKCHANWEMSRDIKECGECHPGNSQGGIPNIIKVSHRALCKRCHRKMEKEKKKTGPTSPCTSCHRED